MQLADHNKRIMLLTGDLGNRVLDEFAQKLPKQFINLGVAETNLVTVAVGLATTGKIPVIYSIASFMSMRPFEFIRHNISYQNQNVKIVGTGAGLAYSKHGSTHQAKEDIALMRVLPGMTIMVPADSYETKSMTTTMIKTHGPTYLRLGKELTTQVYDKPPNYRIGKWVQLVRVKQPMVAILATGVMNVHALQCAKILKNKNVDVSVWNASTLKPVDTGLLQMISQTYRYLVTMEEHSVLGGLGSIVAEQITQNYSVAKLLRLGIPDIFIHGSFSYDNLIAKYGLTPNHMSKKILSFISNK